MLKYKQVPANDKLTPFDELIKRIELQEEGLFAINLENDASISTQQLSRLFHAITENAQITSLDISGVPITESSARELARLPIGTLIAVNCNLGDAEVALLAGNKSLTSLNVNCNRFSKAGAIALAANTHLQQLSARSNRLGENSKFLFSKSQHLIFADISLNRISDAEVKDFTCPLSLETIVLEGNQITQSGVVAFFDQHKRTSGYHFKDIGLSNNAVTSTDEIQRVKMGHVYLWQNSGVSCALDSPPKPAAPILSS